MGVSLTQPNTDLTTEVLKPFDQEAYVQRLLVKAGVTEDELGELLREAIEETKQQLHAEETKFFTHEGEVIDERNVVAWGPRSKAAERVFDLTGVRPQKKTEQGTVINLALVIPDYKKELDANRASNPGTVIDVTPVRAQVLQREQVSGDVQRGTVGQSVEDADRVEVGRDHDRVGSGAAIGSAGVDPDAGLHDGRPDESDDVLVRPAAVSSGDAGDALADRVREGSGVSGSAVSSSRDSSRSGPEDSDDPLRESRL